MYFVTNDESKAVQSINNFENEGWRYSYAYLTQSFYNLYADVVYKQTIATFDVFVLLFLLFILK